MGAHLLLSGDWCLEQPSWPPCRQKFPGVGAGGDKGHADTVWLCASLLGSPSLLCCACEMGTKALPGLHRPPRRSVPSVTWEHSKYIKASHQCWKCRAKCRENGEINEVQLCSWYVFFLHFIIHCFWTNARYVRQQYRLFWFAESNMYSRKTLKM